MKNYITPYSAIIKLQSTENIAGGSQQYINPTSSDIHCTQGNADCYEIVITFNDYPFEQINQSTPEYDMVDLLMSSGALNAQIEEYRGMGIPDLKLFYMCSVYVNELC